MSRYSIPLLSLVLIVFLLLSAAPSYSACSKSLVVNQANSRPYMYIKENGELAGLDYELIRAILDLAGCEYSFVHIPAKRALLELGKGRLDIVVNSPVTPARKELGRFTISYRDDTIAIFIRKERQNSYPAQTLSYLLTKYDLTFGVVDGGYYGEEYEALDKESLSNTNRLILLSDNEHLLDLLRLGRLDAVADSKMGLRFLAIEKGISDKVAIHDIVLSKNLAHLLLSKKSTTSQDMEVIDLAIQKLLSSVEYRSILHRYGMTPFAYSNSKKSFHHLATR